MNFIFSEIISGVIGAIVGGIVTAIFTNRKSIRTRLKSWWIGNKKIRMSISYLFSIRDDEGNYLLIKGNRIQQYQPIGGVYKYFKSFQPIKSKLEVTDEINKNFYDPDDLRIYLPGKNLMKLIEWFKTGENRETVITREFIEEIIAPGLLNIIDLENIDFEYIHRKESGLRFSDHFEKEEYLIYDVFKVSFSKEVLARLKENSEKNPNFLWVSQADIDTKNTYIEEQAIQIGEHAKYITTC